MSEEVKLTIPEMRIVLGDVEDETTWREHIVKIIATDQEEGMDIYPIGQVKRNPSKLLHAQSYAAARRMGIFEGAYGDFRASLLVCELVSEDEVNPTELELDAD